MCGKLLGGLANAVFELGALGSGHLLGVECRGCLHKVSLCKDQCDGFFGDLAKGNLGAGDVTLHKPLGKSTDDLHLLRGIDRSRRKILADLLGDLMHDVKDVRVCTQRVIVETKIP